VASSLAQFEGNGGPEKVHFLEPGYMKHLADTNNQYRGNIRTTFYAQKSGPETGAPIPICNGMNADDCQEPADVFKRVRRPHK
jgi:hypothetical protein